ncbi:MAG: stage III sporulation protein AE [Eubacteriales bacterium]
MVESLLREFDFAPLQTQLDQMFPSFEMSVLELVSSLLKGEHRITISYVFELISTIMISEVGNLKVIFLSILMVGIVSALFSNVSHLFTNHQVADISYYLIYLYLIMILLRTFYEAFETCQQTITHIVTFMKIGIPLFTLSLAMTGKIMTSGVFYQIALLIIFLVEIIVLHFVIPYIYAYVLLSIINGLTDENRFDSLLRLLRRGIEWIMKVMVGLVAGISLIQSLITPAIDSVSTTTMQKVASLIPGIGTVTDAVADMVIGSTIVIKNSIGVAYAILFLLVCLTPFLKILCITILLRGSAAVIGLVCDKRMLRCMEQVSVGSGLLVRTMMNAISMFLVTVAIILFATSKV